MSRTNPETIETSLGNSAYAITIGSRLGAELARVLARAGAGRRIAVITDSTIKRIWGDDFLRTLSGAGLSAELFDFGPGEAHKNQETVTALQHALLQGHYGRDTLIVAFGGGVVGDVAGFVAATFLRGVPYVNVPTTMLAMVDSSVGGKVGIDTPYGKNTVGAFWPPCAVVMELNYLSNLPRTEFVGGLLEAVKTFLTSERSALSLVEKLNLDDPTADPELLQRIVSTSVRIKAGVTARDPREENERKIVNFGHTIGHALELLSKYTVSHGYAIGYGMLAESKMAEILGILTTSDRAEVERVLGALGVVAADMPKFSAKEILGAIRADKKVRAGVPYYVLLQKIGAVHTKDGQYAHAVEDAIVEQALESL